MEQSESPVCKCGFDRTHPYIEKKGRYSFLGWLALIAGASARPKSIYYQCRRCHTIIEETTDPAIIEKFV